jgi:lactoylglutathione lyase
MDRAAAETFDPKGVFLGPKDGRPRILHTMLRTHDPEALARFYVEGFGMDLLARVTLEGRRCDAVFVGFEGENRGAPMELVRYWDDDEAPYTHGTGYGHVAVSARDVPAVFDKVMSLGASVVMAPGVLVPGGPCCAFVKDPEGYTVEIVAVWDGSEAHDPDAPPFDPRHLVLGPRDGRPRVMHTNMKIKDLDATFRFYVETLGMQVQERVDVEVRRATGVFLGFNDDDAGRQLELANYWETPEPYTHGTGYGHVAIGVPDVLATMDRLEAIGAPILRRPNPLFDGSPRVGFVKDPDGYEVELIETAEA